MDLRLIFIPKSKAPALAGAFFVFLSADAKSSADTAGYRWRRLYALGGRGHWPPAAAGRAGVHRRECRRLAAETKGDRTPSMVSCPLLTPLTFLCADTSEMCSETGVRGLGSVRRADFGTLLCPEFPLRYPPRMTVRGHSVHGVRLALRQAPLRSMVYPWSTRRPCRPLAFRRATEGSRVQRKVWGSQEGAREPYGALAPFCLRRQTAAMPGLPIGSHSRLQRRAAVSAEGLPSVSGEAEKTSPAAAVFKVPSTESP